MSLVYTVDHSLIKHSLTILRDQNTGMEEFRKHTAIVSQIMIMEVSRNIDMNEKDVVTQLAQTKGYYIKESLVFVPVLRAGIALLQAAKSFLPWVPVGFIGLERDESTAIAREYYQKFPHGLENKHILVLDPMLATGGSIINTISALKGKGVVSISVVCILAAPEGIKRLQTKYPEVQIFTSVVDSHLNDENYIVPGLGDYGDRYFGT